MPVVISVVVGPVVWLICGMRVCVCWRIYVCLVCAHMCLYAVCSFACLFDCSYVCVGLCACLFARVFVRMPVCVRCLYVFLFVCA